MLFSRCGSSEGLALRTEGSGIPRSHSTGDRKDDEFGDARRCEGKQHDHRKSGDRGMTGRT